MEKLRIGDTLILDSQTRVLSRINKPHKVTLGVSACLCLEELIKAQGAILSQDTLIDKGWRQVGIEVTASSLRVAINQLRRAFLSLQIDKEVAIITVPRSGYRMLTSADNIMQSTTSLVTDDAFLNSTPVMDAASDPSVKKLSSVALLSYRRNKTVLHWSAFLGSSVVIAALLAWGASAVYWQHIVSITYVPYNNVEINSFIGEAKIYIDPARAPDLARIKQTLSLWKNYYPEVEKWNYLYVSDGTASYLYSMFGCTKPLGEQENDCLSFVFKTP